nr:60S ribosomal protein L5-2-like [Tanacetum cinerariifolium]
MEQLSRRTFHALLDVGLLMTTTGNHVFGSLKALIEDEPAITFLITPGLGLNQTTLKSYTRRFTLPFVLTQTPPGT